MSTPTPAPLTGEPAGAADPRELRRVLLTVPAAAAGAAGVVVAVVAGVLDSHHLAAVVSAAVAVAVVLLASGITGMLGVRTATARAEAVFAIAMVSFLTKVLVFAIALAVVGSVDAARRVPFAAGAITAVLVWLAAEVAGVARMRSTGAAVFGPPARTVDGGAAGAGADGARPGPAVAGERNPTGRV